MYLLVLFFHIFSKFRKGHRIYDQLRKLGGSYDWDRVSFTMDDVSSLLMFIIIIIVFSSSCFFHPLLVFFNSSSSLSSCVFFIVLGIHFPSILCLFLSLSVSVIFISSLLLSSLARGSQIIIV